MDEFGEDDVDVDEEVLADAMEDEFCTEKIDGHSEFVVDSVSFSEPISNNTRFEL